MKPAYKQTELGVIPSEWQLEPLAAFAKVSTGSTPPTADASNYGDEFPFVSPADLGEWKFVTRTDKRLSAKGFSVSRQFPKDSILFVCIGSTIGKCGIASTDLTSNQQINVVLPSGSFHPEFLYYSLSAAAPRIKALAGEQAVPLVNKSQFSETKIALPTVEEQRAIAEALSDVDALLSGLDRLIAKKRNLKQAAMQQLLTGQTRLPGFQGEWTSTTLEAATHCLDGLRVPLNEAERATMKGDIPYCGANGVLGFVDRYVIDDDIILIAEDGGYFDEYATRPIAYRMSGKCWVNNHAHILKAQDGFDQGFIFFSLVHKNILPFLASGTRAKLNKSEMNKITVNFPRDKAEQIAIATVLSDMDAELAALEARRDKTRLLKQGMMQELLTGRTRLV